MLDWGGGHETGDPVPDGHPSAQTEDTHCGYEAEDELVAHVAVWVQLCRRPLAALDPHPEQTL